MADHFAKSYDQMEDTGDDPERLERLRFHLQSGDYVPLLCTVLNFLEDGVKACETGVAHAADLLDASVINGMREDLIYLHKHYSIQPKTDA
jgi:hypothetical protein